ncbi:hypothetical protein FQN57_005266 [Myotisia sp. PD_48]|nr:hypothetical protein FQN57_005266 [Myotisia sp. PD_48]
MAKPSTLFYPNEQQKWRTRILPRRSFKVRSIINRMKTKLSSSWDKANQHVQKKSITRLDVTPVCDQQYLDTVTSTAQGSATSEEEAGNGMLPDFSPSNGSKTVTISDGNTDGTVGDKPKELIEANPPERIQTQDAGFEESTLEAEKIEKNECQDDDADDEKEEDILTAQEEGPNPDQETLDNIQQDFDDDIEDFLEERRDLLEEKMIWQVKFVTTIKKRDKPPTGSFSSSVADERIRGVDEVQTRDMAILHEIIDEQKRDVETIKETYAGCPRDILQKTMEKTQAAIDKAKAQNLETAKEITVLRKLVTIAEPASAEFIEFSRGHDLKEALETNKELLEKVAFQKNLISRYDTRVRECADELEILEATKLKLKTQLESVKLNSVSKLEEVENSLIVSQGLVAEAKNRECDLKDQHSKELAAWAADKERLEMDLLSCRENLKLKDSVIQLVQQQSNTYISSFKDVLSMLGERTGDNLSMKLASCLNDTLDRNEMLERELWQFRGRPKPSIASSSKC